MLPTEVPVARLVLVLLALSGLARAMQVKIERPALCERAQLVVIGEVTGFDARFVANAEGAIERVFDVSVERVLRGVAPPEPLRVLVPGGSLGENLHYIVEDAPDLHVDHRYLLLLATDSDGWRVLGLQQGALPLDHDRGADAAAIASLGGCLAI